MTANDNDRKPLRKSRALGKLKAALSSDGTPTAAPPESKPRRPRRTSTSVVQSAEGNGNTQACATTGVSQVAKGNNNTQLAGRIDNLNIIADKSVKFNVMPPPGSIGANALLKERIKECFNQLGLERKKRFGKSAFAVMNSNFKRDFGIPAAHKLNTIWSWDESRAEEILSYLQEKYDNTIAGKTERAAKRPGYKHTRRQLFKMENDFLSQLALDPKSPEILGKMKLLFGTTSHKNMTDTQHQQWVSYLEKIVDKLYESNN